MISRIVWYGIPHQKLNTDAVGQKIELILKENKYLEQGDVKGGLH